MKKTYVIIAIGLALLIAGILLGEPATVAGKGSIICLECIGIG